VLKYGRNHVNCFIRTLNFISEQQELNKIAFTSQTHLYLYLMYYSGNMFRLAIESSSGPYIKIQILNFTLYVLWDPKHLHALC
jgi:hypothetical protein